MKKFLPVLLVFLFLVATATAQDRVNRTKPTFVKESQLFDKATGWGYSDAVGEWIDYKNIICTSKTYKGSSLENSGFQASECKNFINMRIMTVNYKNETWYFMRLNYWSGHWKYPNIREDWEYNKNTKYIVMKEDEYKKLFNTDNTPTHVKYKWASLIRLDMEEADYVMKIIDRFDDNIAFDSRDGEFIIYTSTDGMIRFNFFDVGGLLSGYNKIENAYFETTKTEWNKLLIQE